MFDFFPFTDPGFDYYYQWPCNHQYDYYDYCPYQIFPDCCADDCAVQCYPNYPIDPIGKIIDFLTPEGVKSCLYFVKLQFSSGLVGSPE